MSNKGPLLIVSGPSGSGKSTVISRLLERGELRLHLSVSATTRSPRGEEKDGVHYHFWSVQRFRAAIGQNAFLEWARVHDNYYGTLRAEVEPFREQATGVILDIDVQGAAQVRLVCPDAVSVFLRTSSLATYEERLRARKTEDEAAIKRRLANAALELARAGEYQYQIVNDNLEAAVSELYRIVKRQFEGGDHAG